MVDGVSSLPEKIPDHLNRISGEIVDAAVKVHIHLGPGLLENVYEVCLAYELRAFGSVPWMRTTFLSVPLCVLRVSVLKCLYWSKQNE
ncbi:MAG: GxxExxY protein [Thermoanaerobaculales bacterium]|nr:GxxExxY protein [Thermoanaerobaculales bacterium]